MSLKQFKKWCKENTWNTKYEDEKEFHKINNQTFLELTMNDFSNGDKSVFTSIRQQNRNDFERLTFHDLSNEDRETVDDLVSSYERKHNAKHYR